MTALLRNNGDRSRPESTKFWIPTQKEIAILESNLSILDDQIFSSIWDQGHLALPAIEYYRQYIGIKIKTKKYIYINSVRGSDELGESLKWARERGHENEIFPLHCGNYCWGAIYDPATKEFFDLQIDAYSGT
ncbi:hypothetical protein DFR28_104283 [Arenicella xantha]|uniref:Uncharacterized protein n=2 Tax=Arenicella xantha TaxID=644221 RepID=A0A395JKD7_9GAMM|nr:hypothetical protein DFR28_104283 [Arenicella xantha]